jgi:hypothetical protein
MISRFFDVDGAIVVRGLPDLPPASLRLYIRFGIIPLDNNAARLLRF